MLMFVFFIIPLDYEENSNRYSYNKCHYHELLILLKGDKPFIEMSLYLDVLFLYLASPLSVLTFFEEMRLYELHLVILPVSKSV